MIIMVKRTVIAVIGFLLFVSGYVVGGTAVGPLTSSSPEISDSNSVTGITVSSSGPACVDQLVEENTGWVHTVASGRYYSITFNTTIRHNRTNEVMVNLTGSGSGIYELRIRTQKQQNISKKASSVTSSCQTATRVTGGGAVPTDIEVLRVTVNNKTIQRINIEQTFPTLRRLPNPIPA